MSQDWRRRRVSPPSAGPPVACRSVAGCRQKWHRRSGSPSSTDPPGARRRPRRAVVCAVGTGRASPFLTGPPRIGEASTRRPCAAGRAHLCKATALAGLPVAVQSLRRRWRAASWSSVVNRARRRRRMAAGDWMEGVPRRRRGRGGDLWVSAWATSVGAGKTLPALASAQAKRRQSLQRAAGKRRRRLCA